MKLVWIIPKWPFPMNDGARIVIGKLLLNVYRNLPANIDLKVICIVDSKPDIENPQLSKSDLETYNKLINSIIFIARLGFKNLSLGNLLASFPSLAPITHQRFLSLLVKRALDRELKKIKPDVIFAEALEGCAAFLKLRNTYKEYRSCSLLYRSHNVEYHLWEHRAKSTKNFLLKLVYRLEASLIKRAEITTMQNANVTFAITDQDRDLFKELVKTKIEVLPAGLEFHDFKKKIRDCFAFIGDLRWYPNYHGLEWFIKNVWVNYRGDATLYIIGKGPRPSFTHMSNIRDLGIVRDLKKVYRVVKATLSPIFIGSGARVKIIESASFRTATIGTRFSASGLNLPSDSMIYAENSSDWLKALETDSDYISIGERAFNALKQFDIQNCSQAVINHISEIETSKCDL